MTICATPVQHHFLSHWNKLSFEPPIKYVFQEYFFQIWFGVNISLEQGLKHWSKSLYEIVNWQEMAKTCWNWYDLLGGVHVWRVPFLGGLFNFPISLIIIVVVVVVIIILLILIYFWFYIFLLFLSCVLSFWGEGCYHYSWFFYVAPPYFLLGVISLLLECQWPDAWLIPPPWNVRLGVAYFVVKHGTQHTKYSSPPHYIQLRPLQCMVMLHQAFT